MVNEPYENKHSGIEDDRSQLGIIRNRKSALQWLRKTGWQTSRASFYRHIKQGKLAVSTAGTIDLEDLQIYAAAYLNPVEQPPDCRVVSAIHEQERAARIALLEARKRKLDFENELAAGRYLERDKVILEWCIKLGFMETTLKNMARSKAEEWIVFVGGDPDKAGGLFRLVESDIDEMLGQMGDLDEIRVTIKKQPKEVTTNGQT